MSPRGGRPPIQIEAFHIADFVHPADSPLAGRAGLVMAYAILHPDGVVLFDTGIGTGNADVASWLHAEIRSLPELLAGRGVDPRDVVAIANSHLHLDHCGQNLAFPSHPIYAQEAEYEATRAADYTIPEWVDFPGAGYQLIHGEHELLPGVRLMPTPGHTRGHQSLIVDAAGRTTALVGQAVYTRAEWDGSDAAEVSGLASAWDPEAYRESRHALWALKPHSVLFGHDRSGRYAPTLAQAAGRTDRTRESAGG